MNVVLFGATGMVGQGVLRECLLDPGVQKIVAIGRTAGQQQHEKLRHMVVKDLLDYSEAEKDLSGFDACFFCIGVTSAGMNEEAYRRVTYDITLTAAQTLAKLNPEMTFIYVSGAGADSTEHSRTMWARVRGQTENALLRLPFKGVYIFRPALIQPLHGIKSRTAWYRAFYAVMNPMLTFFGPMLPKYMITTEKIGRAMLRVARNGYTKKVLESADINQAVA